MTELRVVTVDTHITSARMKYRLMCLCWGVNSSYLPSLPPSLLCSRVCGCGRDGDGDDGADVGDDSTRPHPPEDWVQVHTEVHPGAGESQVL